MDINYIKIREKIVGDEELNLLDKAYHFTFSNLKNIENSDVRLCLMTHICGVTKMLSNFNVDIVTLVGSLLYVAVYTGVSYEILECEFSSNIAKIAFLLADINKEELRGNFVSDESKLNRLYCDKEQNLENGKVFLIKLAERFYNMQNMIDCFGVDKKVIVSDTLKVLVPLASKFEFNYIKGKLEDLCLLYMRPDDYNYILLKLNNEPKELEIYLDNAVKDISLLLRKEEVLFESAFRVKSIFSIYQKLCMGKKWEDIYDILAVTIIVDNIVECYRVLNIICSNFKTVSGRFKDYIVNPKKNMYQSLHITIVDNNGQFIEIQIKTYDMNKRNKLGYSDYKRSRQKSII